MKLNFNNIIDKEAGKDAIVLGTGPSLNKHKEKIKNLDRSKYIIIGCNDIDIVANIIPDYWVFSNNEATINVMSSRLNNAKTIVLYSDVIDLTDRADVDVFLNVDYLGYDQRHFNGSTTECTGGNCCKHAIPDRLTIQEEFKNYTKYHTYDTSSDTVIINSLYFSVLLGCKNVYVTGVDLDYSVGYADNSKSNSVVIKNLELMRPRILNTLNIINNSAKNINVNIYSLDNGLHISNVFEYKELL